MKDRRDEQDVIPDSGNARFLNALACKFVGW